MSDGTYQPKVYRKQGGDELVVANGGAITIEAGGSIVMPGSTQYSAGAKHPVLLEMPLLVQDTNGATAASVTLQVPQRLEVIGFEAQKTGAGSSGTTALTVLLATSTDGAISEAINMKGILGTVARAAKIVPSLALRPAGGYLKATRAGSSGTSSAGANVEITARVWCLPRTTT